MSIVAIIPARMASSRFPGKPLKSILGLSMVEHVYHRVSLSKIVDDVIIATCDREIAQEVERFHGKVVMTSPKHEGCVDRVAEAAKNLDAKIIINVQGDMPLVDPDSLEKLVAPLLKDEQLLFADMVGPVENEAELNSPNEVKVVGDKSKNALYYSREPIPSSKKLDSEYSLTRFRQFGINAFRRESLIKFASLPRTILEKIESVDMLRLLENGFKICLVYYPHSLIGVDTPEELEYVKKIMEKDSIFPKYRKDNSRV